MKKYLTISKNIKKYRKKQKITQEKLAIAIYKKTITIKKYEEGNQKIPYPNLINICKILNINFENLFEKDDGTIDPIIEEYSEYLHKKSTQLNQEGKKETNSQTYDGLIDNLIINTINEKNSNLKFDDVTKYDKILINNLINTTIDSIIKVNNYDLINSILLSKLKDENKLMNLDDIPNSSKILLTNLISSMINTIIENKESLKK